MEREEGKEDERRMRGMGWREGGKGKGNIYQCFLRHPAHQWGSQEQSA